MHTILESLIGRSIHFGDHNLFDLCLGSFLELLGCLLIGLALDVFIGEIRLVCLAHLVERLHQFIQF